MGDLYENIINRKSTNEDSNEKIMKAYLDVVGKEEVVDEEVKVMNSKQKMILKDLVQIQRYVDAALKAFKSSNFPDAHKNLDYARIDIKPVLKDLIKISLKKK